VQSTHEPDLENDVLRLLGQVYLESGQYQLALDYLGRALAHADQYKLRRNHYECHNLLSQTYRRMENYRQALHHQDLYHNYKEAVFSDESAIKLQNLEVLYRTQAAQKEAEFYASQYEHTRRFNEQLEAEVKARTEFTPRLRAARAPDRTKSSFISVTAHELRTPLTVLNGYAQMLQAEPLFLADPQASSLLAGILAGAGRLSDIVNTMLLILKIDNRTLEIYPEPVKLHLTFRNLASSWLAPRTAPTDLTLDWPG
jgi:signal transduction histidine kinase